MKLFGFSEYALRLVPFVSSIGSLFLFRRVAGRLLSGPALVIAVASFAVSYPGIRYAAEAKPYGTDMCLSLLMLSLVLDWQQSRNPRFLQYLAVLMPFALGASYPAVFAAGGLSQSCCVSRGRRANGRVGSFGMLSCLPVLFSGSASSVARKAVPKGNSWESTGSRTSHRFVRSGCFLCGC